MPVGDDAVGGVGDALVLFVWAVAFLPKLIVGWLLLVWFELAAGVEDGVVLEAKPDIEALSGSGGNI